jgi:tRNA pseudouridine38-40 synthase
LQVIAAGRTDTGVHANAQVVSVHLENYPDLNRFQYSLNRVLPDDIRIRSIKEVSDKFHARFDALSRTYRYFVCSDETPFQRHYCTYEPRPLNLSEMQGCAGIITGTHDFSGFARHNPDQPSKHCTVHKAGWRTLSRGRVMFEIEANRFLHSMVRLLVGTMMEVGRGKLLLDDFRQVLALKDVQQASPAAPAKGLFLWRVTY